MGLAKPCFSSRASHSPVIITRVRIVTMNGRTKRTQSRFTERSGTLLHMSVRLECFEHAESVISDVSILASVLPKPRQSSSEFGDLLLGMEMIVGRYRERHVPEQVSRRRCRSEQPFELLIIGWKGTAFVAAQLITAQPRRYRSARLSQSSTQIRPI